MSIHSQVFNLLEELALKCSLESGFGNMSPAVYDTAWLAMILKGNETEKKWLFPECFRYLLQSQSTDGSWSSYSSEVDGILNTMAGLLALKRYVAHTTVHNSLHNEDLSVRISKATTSLSSKLKSWNVEETVHVGFEILVPALLGFLEQERDSIHFEFPGRNLLMQINRKKLEHFEPNMLYGKTQTTLLHSLEAFVGKIDFDKVAHHRVSGSIMGSPSATAAYLMNSSTWDDEAEIYLRTVIQLGAGKGSGGVPSAFPSTIFEITWVLSSLLQSGRFQEEILGHVHTRFIVSFLEKELKNGQGCLGFAPSFQADADDTAKGILCLNLLKRPTLPDQMITTFSTGDHFKTFSVERNPSFSANCNVLNMLLHLPNPNNYVQQILEAANFIFNCWKGENFKDKWNLSRYYSKMLMAEALMGLWQQWGSGSLPGISPESPIIEQLSHIIFQVLFQTLNSQKENGTWGEKESPEETAYGVLTLIAISARPWPTMLSIQIKTAISIGQKFLLSQRQTWTEMQYLWVEKVTYGSQIITLSYCLAASNQCEPKSHWGEALHSHFTTNNKAISKFSHFFSQIPMFSQEPIWKVEASLVESYLLLPKLRRLRHEIFPRTDMAEDKYLEYIPFTWIGVNNLSQKDGLGQDILWEMMLISMLNYQVDEYMEAVVGKYFAGDLDSIRNLIRSLCGDSNPTTEATFLKPQKDTGVQNYEKSTDMIIQNSEAQNNNAQHCESHGNGHGVQREEQQNGSGTSNTSALLNVAETMTANTVKVNGVEQIDKGSQNDERSAAENYSEIEKRQYENGIKGVKKLSENITKNGETYHKDSKSSTRVTTPKLTEVKTVLSRFINFILKHPKVRSSSLYAQDLVRYEMKKFLLAHVTQEEDNYQFARHVISTTNTTVWKDARTSYYDWIHNTSADHTSCPYSFAFFSCLITGPAAKQEMFQGVRQKYLAQDVCRHLANLCRQYNDYGSIVRDRQERNLNSVNFPEFSQDADTVRGVSNDSVNDEAHNRSQNGDLEQDAIIDRQNSRESWMKKELFWIANYERQCLDLAIKQLEDHIDETSRNALRVFVKVTDLYGQIYVARDIATSVRAK